MKKRLNLAELLELLRREAEKDGSQLALATRLGISAQYLSDVLNGRREPGESVLKPLNLRRVVTYESEGS